MSEHSVAKDVRSPEEKIPRSLPCFNGRRLLLSQGRAAVTRPARRDGLRLARGLALD
jgi:hypothetical protein